MRKRKINYKQHISKIYEKCVDWIKLNRFWIKFFSYIINIGLLLIILSWVNAFIYKQQFIQNSTLNLLLTVSAAILAFLALLDDFSSFTRTTFFKSNILKILIILIACDLAWVANDKKDAQSEAKAKVQSANDSVEKKNQIDRDSVKNESRNRLYQDSLKKGLAGIANIFINSLKGNSADYRDAEAKITRLIKDSSKREEKYISEQSAVLDVSNILLAKKANDSLYFQIKLTCNHSIAYNVDIPIKIAYLDERSRLVRFYKDNYDFATLEQLEQDKTRTAKIDMPNYDNKKVIIFRIKGTYTDFLSGKLKIPFDRTLAYNVDLRSMVSYDFKTLEQFRKKFDE